MDYRRFSKKRSTSCTPRSVTAFLQILNVLSDVSPSYLAQQWHCPRNHRLVFE